MPLSMTVILSQLELYPEFRAIVTSPLIKKRNSLLNADIETNPNKKGEKYFQVAKSYLAQHDIDSFYIWLEKSLQNYFHPGFDRFNDEDYRLVKKDPLLDSLLVKYFDKSESNTFPCFQTHIKPLLVKRLYCEYQPDNIADCINIVEMHIIREGDKKIPEKMQNLTKLRILKYDWSDFKSFPEVFTKLTNLKTLVINRGTLQFVPAGIGNLIELDTLAIQNHELKSLPVRSWF